MSQIKPVLIKMCQKKLVKRSATGCRRFMSWSTNLFETKVWSAVSVFQKPLKKTRPWRRVHTKTLSSQFNTEKMHKLN